MQGILFLGLGETDPTKWLKTAATGDVGLRAIIFRHSASVVRSDEFGLGEILFIDSLDTV